MIKPHGQGAKMKKGIPKWFSTRLVNDQRSVACDNEEYRPQKRVIRVIMDTGTSRARKGAVFVSQTDD